MLNFSLSLVFMFIIASAQNCQENGILKEIVGNGTTQLQDHPQKIPVTVNMTLYLEDIDNIDTNIEELHMKFTYSAFWTDERLCPYIRKIKNNTEPLTSAGIPELWAPKIFVDNEKNKYYSDRVTPDTPIQIYRNGTLFYRRRVDARINCLMNLKFYPFDTIICSVRFSLDLHTANRTTLEWVKIKPLQMCKNCIQPVLLLTLKKYHTTKQSSVISMDLYFSRKYHFHLWKFYVPVIIVLLLSWIPLWLGRVLILRIYISMSTVIFLGWYYITRPNELHLPYLNALDAWRSINFIFILLAAFESLFVTYMIKTNSPKIKRTHPDENDKFKMLICQSCSLKKKYLDVTDEKTDLDLEILKLKANFKVRFVNVAKEVKIIDSVAKFFFISAYCIFLFFYTFKCYSYDM